MVLHYFSRKENKDKELAFSIYNSIIEVVKQTIELHSIVLKKDFKGSENLKLEFIELLKENESTVSIEGINEYVYHYEILNQSHTLGNLIQSHIIRRSISDDSFISSCGYKKPHPLEEKILFMISVKPDHKLLNKGEINKVQTITIFFLEQIDEIINDLKF